MDEQKELRNRLLVVLRKDPKSARKIAKEIGIGERVLQSFLQGGRIYLKTILLIEKYIEDKK